LTAFTEQHNTLKQVIRGGRSEREGGWPHRLNTVNAATSIVATAHAIELLRGWGHPVDDPRVAGGLGYLATQVSRHTHPIGRRGDGRGEFSRFPAYALWGLTRYLRAIGERRYHTGLQFAVSWLAQHRRPRGGWAVGTGGELSYVSTLPAVHALDRLTLHPTLGTVAAELARDARTAVAFAVQRTHGRAWWTADGPGAPPSAGVTALAVLTLADGNPPQRELARSGIAWLLANPARWRTEVEPDRQLESRLWHIMSFSLGLRAILHPCGSVSASERVLEPAIRHLDALWDPETGAWGEFIGGKGTTSGSFAVVAAVRALKRAAEFDPFVDLGYPIRVASRRFARGARSRRTLQLYPDTQRVRIQDRDGTVLADGRLLGTSQWAILLHAAKHHIAKAPSGDQAVQTFSSAELAAITSVQPASVQRTIRRLNASLKDLVAEQRPREFLSDLIEDITPEGSGERKYGFDEVDIVIETGQPDAVTFDSDVGCPADSGSGA
jgi:hypothetical protein